MPGPLPSQQRRRRNAPTIPTTNLPAGGCSGPAPGVPAWASLGVTGKKWWKWAWKTPQAAAWAPGHEAVVARRASLEDDLAALTAVEGLDVADVCGADWPEMQAVIRHLAALATGKLAILKEMDQLDDRLGLSPKSMAALRWSIVADESDAEKEDDVEDDGLAAVHALHAVS